MKRKTQGWYFFADGYSCWFHGLSSTELKKEIAKHGKVITFEPTC